MVRQVKRDKDDDKGMDTYWKVVFSAAAAVALIFILAAVVPKSSEQSYVYGVKIVSEIPTDQLKYMTSIALYNTTATPAELTCKLELSAISMPERTGYRIRIEEGDTGIYLKAKEATIRGRTPEDMLRACHVFACVRDGVNCSQIVDVEGYLADAPVMSVILDKGIDQATGRGYAEIIGALSYYQIQKADANGDGQIDQAEVDANEYFIYPFVKDGDVCTPQPLSNMVQNWTRQNESAACGNISPAIMFLDANETSIRIDGGKIVLAGSGDPAHTASIVLRDVISPEWVRAFHGYN
ncbi:MAG: hypothetical protein V1875_10435 [Candidatus Altiarchaeota archaeon]